MMDACEPDRYVRHETYFCAELGRDLALVDVVGEGVSDEVIGEILHVVLWRRLCAGSRVA